MSKPVQTVYFAIILFTVSVMIAHTFNQNKKLRFLALGDSYTIGESVDYAERWPVQLAQLLKKEKTETEEPLIIARTGWTTDELMLEIKKEKPQGTFDIVSLLIGVNNQYRGRDTANYRKEFSELLNQAIHFASDKPSHVFVLSIPDWGATPFAEGKNREQIAKEIDAFNLINKEETEKARAHYIDITPLSRKVISDKLLIAPDGLHYSAKMYAQWAELAKKEITKELEKKN